MVASAIFVVDDDRESCAPLSDIISGLGYRVDVAYNGPAALERSRRQPSGLAFLDDNMPGMDPVGLYYPQVNRGRQRGPPGDGLRRRHHRPRGKPGRWPDKFQERSRMVLTYTGRPANGRILSVARPGGGVA
jgi:CheY-like chemotaxis protein